MEDAVERYGSQKALAKLTAGPEPPDAVSYLRDWLLEIHGHSGVGMNGLAPVTYATVESWARLTGTIVRPEEVRALVQLDAALIAAAQDEQPKAPAGGA